MSQLTHPTTTLGDQLKAHRRVVAAALLALIATAAVVLVIELGDDATTSSTVSQAQPAVRSDGGPEETNVAATISRQPPVAPPMRAWSPRPSARAQAAPPP